MLYDPNWNGQCVYHTALLLQLGNYPALASWPNVNPSLDPLRSVQFSTAIGPEHVRRARSAGAVVYELSTVRVPRPTKMLDGTSCGVEVVRACSLATQRARNVY